MFTPFESKTLLKVAKILNVKSKVDMITNLDFCINCVFNFDYFNSILIFVKIDQLVNYLWPTKERMLSMLRQIGNHMICHMID